MIVYNFRANGPYEYDKFILNFGQLYNLIADMKQDWQENAIQELNQQLSQQINNLTEEQSLLNEITLLKEILTK